MENKAKKQTKKRSKLSVHRLIAGLLIIAMTAMLPLTGAFAGTESGAKVDRAQYITDENGNIPGLTGNKKESLTLAEFVNRLLTSSSIEVSKPESSSLLEGLLADDSANDGEDAGKPTDKTGPDYSIMWEDELNTHFDEAYYIERMKELGFYLEDSGDNSLNLRNAIIRTQSSINLPITGTLCLTTKKALLEGGGVAAYDRVESPPTSGLWITINKTSRILTVYSGGDIHKKYPVAVGSKMSYTPDGKFTFVVKSVSPAWGGAGHSKPVAGGSPSNPLGPRWLGLSIGGGGRYGVHGNAAPRSIGTYASLGCVRMINSDVIELFEYIPIGTIVWIGSADVLSNYGVHQSTTDPMAGIPELELEPEPAPEPAREDLALKIELE